MPNKKCTGCGVILAGGNSNFGANKCADCIRVPYARSIKYFDKNQTTPEDIQQFPLRKAMPMIVGFSIIFYAAIIFASLVGYLSGSLMGLIFGIGGGLFTGVIYRVLVSSESMHPLNTKRWYNYGLIFYVAVICVWAMFYMGFISFNTYSGSVFSFRVAVTPSLHISAFILVALIGLAAAIIGAVIGYWNVLRLEKKNKAHTLAHYQRWMETKTARQAV